MHGSRLPADWRSIYSWGPGFLIRGRCLRYTSSMPIFGKIGNYGKRVEWWKCNFVFYLFIWIDSDDSIFIFKSLVE